MRFIKKWLFPALTCLIAAGAAVLPQRISQARDAQQFGQIHAEELDAETLPVYELPSLTDRLTLYRDYSSHHFPILSFFDAFYFQDSPQEEAALAQSAQDQLIQADMLPAWFFEEEPLDNLEAERVLLWNSDEDSAWQEPSTFFRLTWSYSDKYHGKRLSVITDAETGLPIRINIFDTNMSQWLPYEAEPLQALAGRFFDLLGMDAQAFGSGGAHEVWHAFEYVLDGTEVYYCVTRQPTTVTIEPDPNWQIMAAQITDDSSYMFYDG